MPASEEPLPAQLKEWFDEPRYRSIARELGAISKTFRVDEFLRLTLEGLEKRSLMQRLHQGNERETLLISDRVPDTPAPAGMMHAAEFS